MVIKGEPILRSYLIFSVYCILLYPANAQDSTKVPDTTSVVLLDGNQVNYPGKPLIMSLILPGAGQYYNKSPLWKTASFIGVELGSILAWRYYQNKAEELRDNYQGLADLNWSMENWVYNRFNPTSIPNEDLSWTTFSALNTLTGTHHLNLI